MPGLSVRITEHCIDRYLERIAPARLRRSPDARRIAAREIALALAAEPVARLATAAGHTLLCVLNPVGFRFVVKLDEDGQAAQTCGPYWYWHECRKHWQAQGYTCSKGNQERRNAKSHARWRARQSRVERARQAQKGEIAE